MKVQSTVNSYEVGKDPYKPDETRGKWGSIWDFYLVCLGHSFGTKNFCFIATLGFMEGGILHLIPMILSMLLVSVPMYFIQSTLGQFSSTGFISVFRVSPIFKGMGYVILVLNITAITYTSAYGGILTFFWFNSFRSDLPWATCTNSWNSPNCSTNLTFYRGYMNRYHGGIRISGTEYVEDLLHGDFAWGTFGSTIVVWVFVTLFVLAGIQKMGQIVKYTTGVSMVILLVLIIRSLFEPGAVGAIGRALTPDFTYLIRPSPWFLGPFLNVLTLGSGWASVLTLASFNEIRTDNQKYSFALPFCILGLSLFGGLLTTSVVGHLEHKSDESIYMWEEGIDFPFVLFPFYARNLGATHLWLLLFYTMLILLELNTIGVLFFTVVTSIFDEYVITRPFKKWITIGLAVVLGLFSLIYSNAGSYGVSRSLAAFSLFSHTTLNFFELMVYVWAYGRERFLRDVQFILGNPLGQWKFYILRFVTPVILLLNVLLLLVYASYEYHPTILTGILTVLLKVLPWTFIPGYAIYKLVSMTGTVKERFKKGVIPTDWYPVDPTFRREYEAQQGLNDTTHLVGMDELCDDDAEA